MEFFSPTITIPIAKAKQILNIQMEHSHSIINFNVTQKRKREYFDWAPYNNNVFYLLDIYPNLTYFTKMSKLIIIFPNIKRTNITNYKSHKIYAFKKIT